MDKSHIQSRRMSEKERQQIVQYLSIEDAFPNPIKLKFLELDDNKEEDDGEQDNQSKCSKIIDNQGNVISLFTSNKFSPHKEESHQQENTILSDQLSFYRENGINNNEQSEQDNLHDSFLRQLSRKSFLERNTQVNSPFGKSTPNYLKPTSCSVDKSDYHSTAELIQNYFYLNPTRNEGKASAPIKSSTPVRSPYVETTNNKSQMNYLKVKQCQNAANVIVVGESLNSSKKFDEKKLLLETERRAKSRNQTPLKEQEQEYQFKAQPMPKYKDFSVSKKERSHTEFKEFNLNTEERGRIKEKYLQVKVNNEKKMEEESKHFKASEIPEYKELAADHFSARFCSPKQQTQVKAFSFETDKRAAIKTLSCDNSVDKVLFKSKKVPDFTFISSPMNHSPKQVAPFDEQTHQYKCQDFNKSAKNNSQNHEEKENKKQLSSTPFKAQPIKKYKPIEVVRSNIPLTQPESPKLHTNHLIRNTDKKQELV